MGGLAQTNSDILHETVALARSTGSGKSTTLSLLHRAFDPTGVRVLVGGLDIRPLPLESLRDNIGVVFREPFIFARSLAENLRIGKLDATIRNADRILVFDQDRIIESETFDELVPQNGATAARAMAQFMTGGERVPA